MSSLQEKGQAFASTVREKGGAILQWLSGAVNSVISGLEGAKNSAVSGLRGKVNSGSNWLGQTSKSAANFVEQKGNGAANWVDNQSTNAATFVADKGNSTATFISEQSTNAANSLADKNANAANFIAEKGNGAANWVDTQSTNAATFVADKGNSAATVINGQSTNAANWIDEKGHTISQWINEKGNQAVDVIDATGSSAINFIKNPQAESQKLLQKTGEGIKSGWEWSQQQIGKAVNWSQEKVTQLSEKVNENIIQPAAGWVQQKWSQLQGWMEANFPGLTRCWKVFQEYSTVFAGYLKQKGEMVAKWWNDTYPAISAWGHGILDVVGIVGDAIPGVGNIVAAVADILNTVWYAAEGDWMNAGLSAIAIIPYIGSAAKGSKYLGKGLKYVDDIVNLVGKYGDDVIKLFSKYGSKIGELFVKYGDEVIQVFSKYGDQAVEVFAKYGDNALKWLEKQGDNASKFGKETLDKLLGREAKEELTEKSLKELTEKGSKDTGEKLVKENADDATRKAAELPAALATAKAITESNDAIDTPVPVLIGLLNTTVKSKYTWIQHFEARPKKLGHYSIHMIASDHEIDNDYSDEIEQLEKPLQNAGNTTQPGTNLIAGSPEHKAQRWKEYQEREGKWDYEQWSKTYENNMTKATKAHEAAEAYRKEIGWGEPEVSIQVDGATRRLDIADVTKQKAIEYKTGYTSRTQDILWEVERDKKLVQQGWDIEWVFEGIPSQPLLQELTDAGIQYKIK